MARALRIEARIFLLQLLCVLMVLQGEPLLALDHLAAQRAAPPSEKAERSAAPPPGWAVDPSAESAPDLPLPAAPASIAPAEETNPAAGSVWSRLLAATRFAVPARPELPPSPPTKRAFGLPVGGPPTPFPQASGLDAIPVYTGWTLISLPEDPADPSPAAIFGPLAGQLQEAWTYDLCDTADPWKRYAPGDPAGSDLTSIDTKRGIWVQSSAQVLLPSSGTLPETTSIELCPGWNLIGFPAGQPRHPRAVLAPIAGKFLRLYGYDAGKAQPWAVFDPNVPEWASDLEEMVPGRGYWLLATEATTLEIPNQDSEGPDASFTAPADLAVVTKPTDILGRVSNRLLDRWTLSYRAAGEAEWKEIATKRFPVDGQLGTFDPTLLINGLYDLRLEAVDVGGLAIFDEITVSVEGNMKIGNFTLSFVDLEIDVAGVPIQVIRTYDSRRKDENLDFGYGWTLDIRQGQYRTNGPVGRNWQIVEGVETAEGFPVHIPCHDPVELKGHTASVRLSDQEYFRFRPILYDMGPTPGGCFAKVGFTAVSGFTPGAKLEVVGGNEVFYAGDSDQLVNLDTLDIFDPGTVRLTTRDGRTFEVDKADGIRKIRDSNDNQLTITAGAITHSSGLAVALVREQGRVSKITDVLGHELVYDYDGEGDLVTFTDRENAKTRFLYGEHYLESIVDPLGRTPIRNEYGEDGRLEKNVDAFGKEIQYEHRLAQNQELVTNRLGKSRLLEYDDRGNVTKEIDELGHVTTRTFDGEDHLRTETDPLGHTTVNVYEQGNLTSTIDPLNHTTRFTYNGRGDVETITDPLNHVTTNKYDTKGNLEFTKDALDHKTSYTYYPDGSLWTETDALGHVTTYAYDGYGHLEKMTDAKGHVTNYEFNLLGNQTRQETTRTRLDGSIQTLVSGTQYDRQQRAIASGTADGAVTRTEYDASGQIKATIDPLGRKTTYKYDELGRQIRTEYPDGLSEEKVYDAENRVLESRDREGRATRYKYDDKGRLEATTYPDGAVTRSAYDKADRPVTLTDARNKATTLAYDDAGRRTKVIDALNHTFETTYDAAGNQETSKDPKSHVTTFVYDELNRRTKTLLADGFETTTVYDELGRRRSKKDQAEKETSFGYDELGRLTSVKDAMGFITTYRYDEVGNLTKQIDANGHITSFEYDGMGRQIARILPDGATERFTYDLVGNKTSRTDFKGITTLYEYDKLNRLERRRYPGGTQVSFTYTPSGQRKTAVDDRGTSRYEYDERNRLSAFKYPDGRKLTYAYDHNGNRTALTAIVGSTTLTTSYTYDDLNRLETVTDPQGGVTSYGFDPNGNRQSLQHSNGVVTSYGYDEVNRLENIVATNSAGAPITSFVYTLGPTGNRKEIVELDGTVKTYGYDDLYRLTSEVVTQNSAPWWSNIFQYDPVGNRRIQNRIEIGGTSRTISYAYDARDRLTTENSSIYGWDLNGNLTSVSGSKDGIYEWDFENRLKRVVLADGTVVAHTYDVDGIRVRTTTKPAQGSSQTVDYLVDTSGRLSQIVAESIDTSLTTYYVRGYDLLAIMRPSELPGFWSSRNYHVDGLGSVRTITDESGVTRDIWNYSAFGELSRHEGTDPNSLLFAGEMLDPNSGLYYNRARWMVPGEGRFASTDPFAGNLGQPLTLTKYPYANLDPANQVDPSGKMSSKAEALIGLGVVAILGFLIFKASGRGAFTSQYKGIPISIWTQPVIIRGSGWDIDDAEATIDAASALWMKMAMIKIFRQPVIEYTSPDLTDLPVSLGGYKPNVVPNIATYPGHITFFNHLTPGACGISGDLKTPSGNRTRTFLPSSDDSFYECAMGYRGLHLAHEFGHLLLNEGEGKTLGLMGYPSFLITPTMPSQKAEVARQNALQNPIWKQYEIK